MQSKSFIISCWNVQGLRSSAFGLKSRTPDFTKELGDADVIVLQETWSRGDISTGCPLGYREIVFPSTKLKGVTQGRDSGGMLIWFKEKLVHSIELIKKGEFSIWLKIKREVVAMDKDIFMYSIQHIYPHQNHLIIVKIVSPFLKMRSISTRPREVY